MSARDAELDWLERSLFGYFRAREDDLDVAADQLGGALVVQQSLDD